MYQGYKREIEKRRNRRENYINREVQRDKLRAAGTETDTRTDRHGYKVYNDV